MFFDLFANKTESYVFASQTAGLLSSSLVGHHSPMAIFFSFLYSFIFLFGILANLLVIFTFLFKNGSKASCKNAFLINLCLSDILVIMFCIPIAISDQFSPNVWYYGFLYCKIYFLIEYCVTSASSLTIICIGVERYLALVNPVCVNKIFFLDFKIS